MRPYSMLERCCLLGFIFDGGIMFIQDILLDYMLPHPRRKCCSMYDGCSTNMLPNKNLLGKDPLLS
jgi:hypothetical protein